jgi:hypothetical protein
MNLSLDAQRADTSNARPGGVFMVLRLSMTKVMAERLAARRAKSNRHRAKGEGSAIERPKAVRRFTASRQAGTVPAARDGNSARGAV